MHPVLVVLTGMRTGVSKPELQARTEDAAEGDFAMDEPGESIPWDQVKSELGR
jgi:hypothetical protein